MVVDTVAVTAAVAVAVTSMCRYGWHESIMGFPMGSIVTLILLMALMVLAYKLYTNHQQGRSFNSVFSDKSSSLQILENRLAKGEISIEEFEKLKQILHS